MKNWLKIYLNTVIVSVAICGFIYCFVYLAVKNESSIIGAQFNVFSLYQMCEDKFMMVFWNKPVVIDIDKNIVQGISNFLSHFVVFK